MSENLYDEALKEAEILTEASEDELFTELGKRIEDIQNIGGYERLQKFTAEFAQDADDMLSVKDLKKIGHRWWNKLEPELMNLVCDQNNEDLSKITSGKTIPQIAASLATAAVISTFAAPAWIIVATSILAAKIAETGLDSICEVWRESLQSD